MIQLRPYQSDAIGQLYDWFGSNKEGNPIVSACVGAGKSVMIAKICKDAAHGFDKPGRVLVVVPSKELAEQNHEKIALLGTGLRIGIMSASMGRKDYIHDKDVVLGTVGTLAKRAERLGFFDLVLIDECHLVSRIDAGMYRDLIRGLKRNNHALRVIGWTGTPFRGNGIWLTEGEHRLFSDIAARITMQDLLKLSFLSPLRVSPPVIRISGEGVTVRNGDYIVSQLAQRLDKPEITKKIAGEIYETGKDRRKWLVFCCTVEHAEHMAVELKSLGVACAVISANTPKAERAETIRRFRAGNIRAICNVAVLTTGFDVPEVDLIALVRNTKSPVLYTQIAGRGMRISPHKQDCLWLDFTDTTALLGPVDEIRGRAETKKDEKGGKAPFKICDLCGTNNSAGASKCKECNKPFPEPAPKINTFSSQASILSGTPRLETFEVDEISYQSMMSRQTGMPYLKITFRSAFDFFHLNLMLEHDGYPRKKALQQLKELTGVPMEPSTVATACIWLRDSGFVDIESITVDMATKWKNVISWKLRDKVDLSNLSTDQQPSLKQLIATGIMGHQ